MNNILVLHQIEHMSRNTISFNNKKKNITSEGKKDIVIGDLVFQKRSLRFGIQKHPQSTIIEGP